MQDSGIVEGKGLRVVGLPTEQVTAYRNGALDAQGQAPEVHVAEGLANPCRHCLGLIAEGDDKLVLSYRPFDRLQPYSECGPIFLHREECARYVAPELPGMFQFFDLALVRGYDAEDWIVYETGAVVSGVELAGACRSILERSDIRYVHIRSKYNCFQCRVEREEPIRSPGDSEPVPRPTAE